MLGSRSTSCLRPDNKIVPGYSSCFTLTRCCRSCTFWLADHLGDPTVADPVFDATFRDHQVADPDCAATFRDHGVAEPDLALLVIDGTIGQQCFSQAEAFNRIVPVGGIVITKLDSSAKGGGALAASAATGAQVMYVGTGERIDDLEQFSPTRFVGRLLGMGDVQAVLDLAKRLENGRF